MTANTYTGGNIENVGASSVYIVADGVDLGVFENPTKWTPSQDVSDIQFEQDAAPRGSKVTKEGLEVDLVALEATFENLMRFLGDTAIQDGSNIAWGGNRGITKDTHDIYVYFQHPEGHPLSGRYLHIFKGEFQPSGGVEHNSTSNDFEGYPIKIIARLDTTQPAYKQLCEWDAVITTPPAVHSTTPATGATGVSKTADIVVNFDYDDSGVTAWSNGVVKALDDLVAPTVSNGLIYICRTAGTTDSTEPTWPTTPGNTVVDGTAEWECVQVHMGAATITDKTVILMKDSGLSFVDLSGSTALTLDTDHNTLTIAHAALSGTSDYYLILSGLATSSGVPLPAKAIAFQTTS